MTLHLLGRNRITKYIQAHPESRVDLLSWLQQFPYVEGKATPNRIEGMAYQGFGEGSSNVKSPFDGIGAYLIFYTINHDAKIMCITWLGTEKEYQIKISQEMEAMKAENPDLVFKTVKVTVQISPPPPGIQVKKSDDEILESLLEAEVTKDYPSISKHKYESCVARATSIVKSLEGSAEFKELITLVPSIKNYEAMHLEGPPVYAYEIANHRMKLFEMNYHIIALLTGYTEDEIKAVLNGEPEEPEGIMRKIFSALHLPYIVK